MTSRQKKQCDLCLRPFPVGIPARDRPGDTQREVEHKTLDNNTVVFFPSKATENPQYSHVTPNKVSHVVTESPGPNTIEAYLSHIFCCYFSFIY